VIRDDPTGRPVDPAIRATVEAAAAALEAEGHLVEEASLGVDLDRFWATYTAMTCTETAGFFDWMEGVVGRPVTPGDVEPVTWAIIERGRATRAVTHAGRVEELRQTGRAIVAALGGFDLTLTPTLTQPPRPVGYYDMALTDLDAYNALWSDAVFMAPFNASGQPAMSLPLGMAAGLPAGVQLVGRPGDEATVLAAAALLEQVMPWSARRPPLRW
jgi:amidase